MPSTNLVRPLKPNEKHVGWVALSKTAPTQYLMGQNGGRIYTTPGRAIAAWKCSYRSQSTSFDAQYTLHPIIIEVD